MLGRPRATAGCPEGSSSAGARPTASQALACWAARSWSLSSRSWLKASICFRVKSDRKSSPTGSQVHRRTSITLIPGASARSSIFGFSGRSSPTHSPAYCSPANFSPACFSPAHLGHGPALRGARSTSASRRGLGTRIGNESRELEPGTGTGATPSESPLPVPWS